MKRLAGSLALILVVSAVPAQYKLVTRATPPAREALERLSLVPAWHSRIPVHGQRDGIFSVQILPGERTQLIVQTHGGLVALLDAESGGILWRTQVGIPGWVSQGAGANSDSIFVTRRQELHVLNRRNGYERVYEVERDTKQVTYGMPLLAQPSAEPTADDDTVYLSLTGKMVAYALPLFDGKPRKLEAPTGAGKDDAPDRKEEIKPVLPKLEAKVPYGFEAPPPRPRESSLHPAFAWSYSVGDEVIQQPPLLGGNQVAVVTTSGDIISLNRFEGKQRLDYRIAAHISRGAANHGALVYVGGDDTYVYALNLENGSLLWRHLAGAPLAYKPAVTDRDVFVAPTREGLFRLQRSTGRELWRNPQVERFLAVNQRFVYALDSRGYLHVMDGQRGTTLAKFDLQDWNIAVPNEISDRIYLASRDGQILCLRHRDHPAPLALKSSESRSRKVAAKEAADEKKAAEVARPAAEEEKKEEKKAEEKKAEEKKDEDKKEEKKAEEKKDEDKKEEKKVEEKKDEDKKEEKKVEEKKDEDKKEAKSAWLMPGPISREIVAQIRLDASRLSRREVLARRHDGFAL